METKNVEEGRHYPIMLTTKDGKSIGVEYVDGKFVLVGDVEDANEGAITLLDAIKDRFTSLRDKAYNEGLAEGKLLAKE